MTEESFRFFGVDHHTKKSNFPRYRSGERVGQFVDEGEDTTDEPDEIYEENVKMKQQQQRKYSDESDESGLSNGSIESAMSNGSEVVLSHESESGISTDEKGAFFHFI